MTTSTSGKKPASVTARKRDQAVLAYIDRWLELIREVVREQSIPRA